MDELCLNIVFLNCFDCRDLVEDKMMLDTGSRHVTKSNLPFTILGTDGNSLVLHLFMIPNDRRIYGVDSSEKPRFGVVTMNGCITVYDTMVRCKFTTFLISKLCY